MSLNFPEIFDSTMLGYAKSCRYKFWLAQMPGNEWKPVGESVHLHAGKAFATGLEVARKAFYVDGASEEDAIAAGMRALLTSYGAFECPPESAKSLERTAGALEYYFDLYPLSTDQATPITLPSGKRGIEFSFATPLPVDHPETGQPILFVGRMDMVVNYSGGIYVHDDKTATQLGASWSNQWDLRGQFTGYCWGLRETAGIEATGCLIRGVSILKTKYDTQQAITYRPKHMVDEWLFTTVDLIEDLKRDFRRDVWRKDLNEACGDWGGCAYKRVCVAQDPGPWLNQFYERKHWDPVLRTETLL